MCYVNYMDTKKRLQIRYNIDNKGALFWRVIADNQEYLADFVNIQVPTFTSQDFLPDGSSKFHISCYYSELQWDGTNLTVK